MERPRPDIPDANPEDWTTEDIEELGVQRSFFVLGQIRAHELTTGINLDQLLAALGIPATRGNLERVIQEVRGKVIRRERKTRGESAFSDLLEDANIDDLGPAVFGYTNGFHAALAQLAKTVSTIHIVETEG